MSAIKKCFPSRWGKEGSIVEADFSQLEVIGVAFLSQDMNMYEDIENGIDAHSQSAAWLAPYLYPGKGYTYKDIREGYLAGDSFFNKFRKSSKGPRFELQYGAGYKSIALNNKISEKAAKGFVEAYYGRYWRLKEWQEENIARVQQAAEHHGDRTPKGYPARRSTLVLDTGRRFTFIEQDAPDFLVERGVYTSFSPTAIKNYPSQGFATGDIVPLVMGKLMRKLATKPHLVDKCLTINTVHDSIIFDVHNSVLKESSVLIKETMEAAPEFMKETFGIVFDLELPVDVEAGLTWSEVG